jgi:hypothetical protein
MIENVGYMGLSVLLFCVTKSCSQRERGSVTLTMNLPAVTLTLWPRSQTFFYVPLSSIFLQLPCLFYFLLFFVLVHLIVFPHCFFPRLVAEWLSHKMNGCHGYGCHGFSVDILLFLLQTMSLSLSRHHSDTLQTCGCQIEPSVNMRWTVVRMIWVHQAGWKFRFRISTQFKEAACVSGIFAQRCVCVCVCVCACWFLFKNASHSVK